MARSDRNLDRGSRPNAEGEPARASTPLPDIVAEAWRVLRAGQAIPLRLVGGLAIAAVTPSVQLLEREYKDIDFVTARGKRSPVVELLTSLGYEGNETFNALHGQRRLLFYDTLNERQVDVFVGSFEMCHSLPIADRLLAREDTVSLADLLLTKLQIFSLNEKDQRDVLNLIYHQPLTESDADGINAKHVSALCAGDWGLWRTVTMNLERVRTGLLRYDLTAEQQDVILSRLDDLRRMIDAEPKKSKWKLRARVGDRVRWYDEPEEVH